MAEIQITVLYDGDDDADAISRVLDSIAEDVGSSDFGVQVDGEHRDPDAPGTSLF